MQRVTAIMTANSTSDYPVMIVLPKAGWAIEESEPASGSPSCMEAADSRRSQRKAFFIVDCIRRLACEPC